MTEVVTNSAASLQQSLAAERQLRGFGLLVQTRKQTPKALLLLRGRPARLLLMQWRDSPSLTNLKQIAAKIGRLALSSRQDVQQKHNKMFLALRRLLGRIELRLRTLTSVEAPLKLLARSTLFSALTITQMVALIF